MRRRAHPTRTTASPRAAARAAASIGALVVVLALVTGCSGSSVEGGSSPATSPAPGATAEPPGAPTVAVSTPLIGSLVRSVGGDAVMIDLLVAPGTDPATATVADPDALLARTDLLVLVDDETFERGLADVVRDVEGGPIEVLELAPQLNPIPFGGSELDPGSTDAGGATDPHVWLDPDRWTQAARLVGDQLVELGVDPALVQANVAAFDEAASAADERMQASFALVPEAQRTAGTDLGGLGYLADRYGIELVFATDADALGRAVAERGITAVFTSPAGGVDVAPGAGAGPAATVYLLDLDATGFVVVPDTPAASTQAWATLLDGTSTAIVDALTA